MAQRVKHNKGFSWKIFGDPAQLGDRMTLTQSPHQTPSQMEENDDGVFIFLPKNGNEFYENDNKLKTKLCLKAIDILLSLLSRQEIKKNQKNIP